uniref:condensin complex subunit 3 isoform X2 n=1 Tax=Ciona intestinalis TaxID=7719 RepID=UPI000180B426|nr:condensin complex subunit 3 isoform X2 [Ciona intestinalis]|eukprot:XP_002127415.1 condensin complex subunit 3 isoform X2 [Ciona intestinalis]
MEIIKNKVREAFEKSEERRYNFDKLAEVLKKFYNEQTENNEEARRYFFTTFRDHCEYLLVISSRDLPVERCLQFAAKFASFFANVNEEEEELEYNDPMDQDLYTYIFSFMLEPEFHSNHDKTVRFRICQFVQYLLSAVPSDATMDGDLIDNATKVLLDRIQDKVPSVRAQAAKSLSRLQQPGDKNCPVIEAYLFHMAADDNTSVRSAALSAVSLTTKTLPEVIDRIRDISESVRKIAFQVLSQKVGIKALTSSQRLHLIKQGLLDGSEAVRNVVKKQLLQAWLLSFKGNILQLFKKLDVVGAFETCSDAIVAIFENSSMADLVQGFLPLLNEEKLVEHDVLVPEAVFYWSQLCNFLRSKGQDGENQVEDLLPTTFIFASYIEKYMTQYLLPFVERIESLREDFPQEEEDDKIEKEFVAEQLVKMAVKMDLSDDAGRRKLVEVLKTAYEQVDVLCFPCLTSPLAESLLKIDYHSANKTEEEHIALVANMISSAREGTSPAPTQDCLSEEQIVDCKLKIAKVSVKINEANEQLEEFITDKNFEDASKMQKIIDDLKGEKRELEDDLIPKQNDEVLSQVPEKDDAGTLIKCLKLMTELLSSIFLSRMSSKQRRRRSQVHGMNPTILQLLETLVLPSILIPAPEVRGEAVKCLATSCMFSVRLAAQHFPLFMKIAQADVYNVRVEAINAANDFLRIFGINNLVTGPMEENEESGDGGASTVVLSKFMNMLEDEESEVREASACLLTRVLISHRILSSVVVSRLILLWYNPSTSEETKLLQHVNAFLDAFPYMSKAAHDCIEFAFLPTLRIFFNAPPSSPYASVDINNVSAFLVCITRPSIIEKADVSHLCDHDKKWLEEGSAHDNLAVMISNEVLSDPKSPHVNVLCRMLPMLELNIKLTDNLKSLMPLCDSMLEEVTDKAAIRHLKKFLSQVQLLIKNANIPTIHVEENVTNECEATAMEEQSVPEVKTPPPSENTKPSTDLPSSKRKSRAKFIESPPLGDFNSIILNSPRVSLTRISTDEV